MPKRGSGGGLNSRERPAAAFHLSKHHFQALSHVFWIGVGFAALRLLQTPSTMTFFVFEAAVAAALGIFLSARAMPTDDQIPPTTQMPSDLEEDARESSPSSRIRSVAARLSLPPVDNLDHLINHPTSGETPHRILRSNATDARALGDSLVDRVAAPVQLLGPPRDAAAADDRLGILAKEGGTLLSLAQDLGVDTRFYSKALTKTRVYALGGRMDEAVESMANGNRRLRVHLSADIARDLRAEWGLPRSYVALSTLFVVCVSLALLTLAAALYVAPLTFYFLASCTAGVLSLNVHVNGNKRWRGLLLQTVMLATLVKFQFFYLNPYLYTSDSFIHFSIVQGIADTGHVPTDVGHYSFFPGYHVFSFASTSVTGLPVTWFGLFAFVAQLGAIPIVYLIGRRIADHRVGLFAAVFTLFSVFFFLPAVPLPSLFGLVFLFIALYASVRMEGTRSRFWSAVFWTAALAAFFSHPVNALVLLLALFVRFALMSIVQRGATGSSGSTIPALSYGILYAAYLSFIASVSFGLFVASVFGTTDVPTFALATVPVQTLQASDSYLLQSAIAPLGTASVFLFATYGMLANGKVRLQERRFLMVLTLAFVLMPALEFLSENYRTQSSRFLSYMAIPLVLVAALGVVSLTRGPRRLSRTAGVVLATFLVLGFFSASSYLTNNDVRYLYPDVPAIPTHITESTLASRGFLTLATRGSLVYMDFGSLLYFENSDRARNALVGQRTRLLDQIGQDRQAFVELSWDMIPYGNPYAGYLYNASWIQSKLQDAQASRLFDAGTSQVYLTG